jgi:hypothetical protein
MDEAARWRPRALVDRIVDNERERSRAIAGDLRRGHSYRTIVAEG